MSKRWRIYWNAIITKCRAIRPQGAGVPNSGHLQRVWDAGAPVGYDCAGNTVTVITVITSTHGEIITDLPGVAPLPQQDL